MNRGVRSMDSMCRRHIRHLLCFMTLVMMVLVLCSAFISLLYGSNSNSSAVSTPAGFFTGRHESVQPTENRFFLAVLSAQLVLQELKPAQGIAGRIQNRQIAAQIIAGALTLSLSGMLFFVHYFSDIAGKKYKHRSVIAFLIGGHAPPSSQA